MVLSAPLEFKDSSRTRLCSTMMQSTCIHIDTPFYVLRHQRIRNKSSVYLYASVPVQIWHGGAA